MPATGTLSVGISESFAHLASPALHLIIEIEVLDIQRQTQYQRTLERYPQRFGPQRRITMKIRLYILFPALLALIAAFSSSVVYASGMQDDVDQ